MSGAVNEWGKDETKDTLASGSQSGIWTSETLTERSLEAMREWLMSSPLASRSCASPSQSPESNSEPTTNEICGPPRSSAFAWYDRDTASLRMSQGSLRGMDTSAPSSETWPRAGTMLDGECYLRPKWERRIREIDSGLWPTARVEMSAERKPTQALLNKSRSHGWDLETAVYDSVVTHHKIWPTPRAIYGEHPGITDRKHLPGAAMLPTPTSSDANGHQRSPNKQGGNALREEVGGKLNPTWVEWLMGWPENWTSQEPLGYDTFRNWRDIHEEKLRSSTSAENDKGESMRNVWWEEDPSETPPGRQPTKQQIEQSDSALPEVPREDTHPPRNMGSRSSDAAQMQDMRFGIPANTDAKGCALRATGMPERERETIGRVAVGVKNRVSRLKALGNGQVSIVAATAWRLLSEDI